MFEVVNTLDVEVKEIVDIQKFIEFAVEKLEITDSFFNIIIVDNKQIREINNQYRHIDRETDVISFALEDNLDLEYEDFRLLGDIYISLDKANSQKYEYNHSLKRELCFLSIHGLLHLLGYDHMVKEDEEIMFSLQEELLNEAKILR